MEVLFFVVFKTNDGNNHDAEQQNKPHLTTKHFVALQQQQVTER